MARRLAQFNVAIWNDEDYRRLPALAQWLYEALWTHPSLSYCGVVDWRPGKLAGRCADLDAATVQVLGDCLEARHFIVRDADAEECLIRSWVRWDGLLSQPKLAVSYVNAYADVASSRLRGVIVHEAQKLREREPELRGWSNAAVNELLSRPAVDPKVGDQVGDPFGTDSGLASTPFGPGFTPGFGPGFTPEVAPGFGGEFGVNGTQGLPEGLGRVWDPPTPAPAPAPLLQHTMVDSTSIDSSSGGRLRSADADPSSDRFDEFWSAYPSRGQHANPKKPARDKWRVAVRKTDPEVIITAAKAYAQTRRSEDPRTTAQAVTWLNQERWADQPAATPDADSGLPWTPEPPPRDIQDDPEACDRWYRQQAEDRRRSA